MFIIEVNLWFKFSGKIFANTYSIIACSFFIIRWIRWSSSNGVVPWCLVPHIHLASSSPVFSVPLHRNSVTSSPVYYRWSDRHRFYYCQNSINTWCQLGTKMPWTYPSIRLPGMVLYCRKDTIIDVSLGRTETSKLQCSDWRIKWIWFITLKNPI